MARTVEIVIGTHNPAKAGEMADLLGELPVPVRLLAEPSELPEVEESGASCEENAVLKAMAIARCLGKTVLSEDSGLEVDALGGRPGILSARYGGPAASDEDRNRLLLAELDSVPDERRTARFRCVAALAGQDGLLFTSEGVVEGRIARSPKGDAGFGYDPIFVPEGYDRTFAELGLSVKHRLSHRSHAIRKMRKLLLEYFANTLNPEP